MPTADLEVCTYLLYGTYSRYAKIDQPLRSDSNSDAAPIT